MIICKFCITFTLFYRYYLSEFTLYLLRNGFDAAVNKKDYKLFGAFFKENFPFLVMFADKYVNDMDMAADIAQEAFIQLWRFKGEFYRQRR